MTASSFSVARFLHQNRQVTIPQLGTRHARFLVGPVFAPGNYLSNNLLRSHSGSRRVKWVQQVKKCHADMITAESGPWGIGMPHDGQASLPVPSGQPRAADTRKYGYATKWVTSAPFFHQLF